MQSNKSILHNLENDRRGTNACRTKLGSGCPKHYSYRMAPAKASQHHWMSLFLIQNVFCIKNYI